MKILDTYLKIGDVPEYPFVNQWFDLKISLTTETGRLVTGREIPLTVLLNFDNGERCTDHLLDIDSPSRTKIDERGTARIKCKILDLSARYGERRFVIVATPLLNTDIIVKDGVSSPMMPIRHRLLIENESDIPSLWYKDHGGKYNCISIVVKLVGKDIVTTRNIPIKTRLDYVSGGSVTKENILIVQESCMRIDHSGRTEIKVRINEVSKRHQGRHFRIVIAPDTIKDPSCFDVSPAVSPAIEVRSKITARSKRCFPYVTSIDGTTPDRRPAVLPRISNTTIMPSVTSIPTDRHISDIQQYSPADPSTTQNESSMDAMHISKWVDEVVTCLTSIRWIEIGREIGPGGTIRPLYEVINPNSIIDTLLAKCRKIQLMDNTFQHRTHPLPEVEGGEVHVEEGSIRVVVSDDDSLPDSPPEDLCSGISAMSWPSDVFN